MDAPSWMPFVSYGSLKDDRNEMMEMGRTIEYAVLHLNLEGLSPLCEISSFLVVLLTRVFLQSICVKVQGFFVVMVYETDDLQCFIFLVSFVTSTWNWMTRIGFGKI